MNSHDKFIEFNTKICLNEGKRTVLKNNNNSLRKTIVTHHNEKKYSKPLFYRQGSYALNTIINPIIKYVQGEPKVRYDLDDGIYIICPLSIRKNPDTYHNRIKEAVENQVNKVIDKNTCVRCIYSDGHHIDFPIYWLENKNDTPQLADKSKGFTKSDPKEFKNWVNNIKEVKSRNNEQLIRVIRYLKAWKDFKEDSKNNLKLPSGFILTILVCNNFSLNDRDDISITEVICKIKKSLDANFSCVRPTTPKNEELLTEIYSKSVILRELDDFLLNAKQALKLDSEYETCNAWRNIFGSRFPHKNKIKPPVKNEIVTPSPLYGS